MAMIEVSEGLIRNNLMAMIKVSEGLYYATMLNGNDRSFRRIIVRNNA